jgi:hypothetical protein
MQIRTFWTVVIKILGFWLIFEFLEIFSQLVMSLLYVFVPNTSEELVWSSLSISILILLIYFLVILLFLFKSTWIIDKLKLDQNSGTEIIQINLKAKTIITVAVIIIGGVIFINGFALLSKCLYDYSKQQKLPNYNPTISWIIFNSIKALLGYLLMTNSKIVVNYINKQSQID